MKRRELMAAAVSAVALPAWPTAPTWRPVEGRHYVRVGRLADAEPATPEVLEFFTYGCRQCFAMEPLLGQWEATLSPKVRLRRLPLALWDDFNILQDLYFALEAIDLVPLLHLKVFEAVQRKRRRLETEDQVADFVAEQGIERSRFLSTLNSDAVAAKSFEATQLAERYNVSRMPAFVVNGRWMTDIKRVGSPRRALDVLDTVVRRGQ